MVQERQRKTTMNKKESIVVLCAILLSVQTIFAQQKNSIGMELRMIPKGSFYMGSDGLEENYA